MFDQSKHRGSATRSFALLFAVLTVWQPSKLRAENRTLASEASRQSSVDAAKVNDAKTRDEVKLGSAGSAVVRLQILLDRAHFSPGQIDGRYGDNLRMALKGYQAAHRVRSTGIGDAATWRCLNADTAPILVAYTISSEDTAGPFVNVPTDMMQQAKLNYLGYKSPEDKLGERFHIDSNLLASLNPGKKFENPGEQIVVPNIQRDYSPQAEKVVVNKTDGTVTTYGADGGVLSQYPATMGSRHDPLPLGDWKILGVQQDPVFYYNPKLFWNAKPDDSKARVAPGPRNPVGVVWISLSKEHYGIHGTPDPSKIGHTESHGCIRLTNWDAEELSKMLKPGVPAILRD